jgi:acylphosphatase
MTEAEGIDRREVYYAGLVQGVGFRYTARRIAARFGLTGYVQNLPDGRVLLVAEGPPEEQDRFLAEVRSAMGRYIEDIDEAVRPATGQFRDFGVRY